MATNENALENCGIVNLGTVEYTYIDEGKELPKSFDLKDFYITKLLNKTYRIFKKVQTETEKAVLRYWNAEKREYVNLSWIPKGWGPSAADIARIANGGTTKWLFPTDNSGARSRTGASSTHCRTTSAALRTRKRTCSR